ncbi:ribosome maturation factor RimP, partial [Striga asiatica]
MQDDTTQILKDFLLSHKEENIIEAADIRLSSEEYQRRLFGKVIEDWITASGKRCLKFEWQEDRTTNHESYTEMDICVQCEEDKIKVQRGKTWTFDGQYLLLKVWKKWEMDFLENFGCRSTTYLCTGYQLKLVNDVISPRVGTNNGRIVKILAKAIRGVVAIHIWGLGESKDKKSSSSSSPNQMGRGSGPSKVENASSGKEGERKRPQGQDKSESRILGVSHLSTVGLASQSVRVWFIDPSGSRSFNSSPVSDNVEVGVNRDCNAMGVVMISLEEGQGSGVGLHSKRTENLDPPNAGGSKADVHDNINGLQNLTKSLPLLPSPEPLCD